MLESSAKRVLENLKPSDVVVDIGAWAQPFTRANYVIDLMPYETRGVYGHIGPEKECFTRETWLNVDVCTDSLPFADKSVDYLICSHTLEDLRDPVRVCKEINRVAKAGYIEVPSRRMETIRNLEHPGYPGYYHHHWLVEIEGQVITFRFKTPLMSSSWRYTFPRSYVRKLPAEDRVAYLFWQDAFAYREVVQLSEAKVASELEAFVRRYYQYPGWRYFADSLRPDLRGRVKRALKRTKRFRPIADRLLGRRVLVDEDQIWAGVSDHDSR